MKIETMEREPEKTAANSPARPRVGGLIRICSECVRLNEHRQGPVQYCPECCFEAAHMCPPWKVREEEEEGLLRDPPPRVTNERSHIFVSYDVFQEQYRFLQAP